MRRGDVERVAAAHGSSAGSGLRRRAALPLLATLALLVSLACRDGEAVVVEERYEVGGPIVLVVDVADAAVLVESGERTAVIVTAEYVSERYDFASASADGTVSVSLERSRGMTGLGVRGGAELRLAVPRGSRVEIQSSNGAVTVNAPIEGGVVRTTNGRIEIGESEGSLSIESSNGALVVGEHMGSLDARTENGSIAVREHYGGPVAAETKNGSIEYRGELAVDTANRLSTTNGSVSIELLGEPSVVFDAQATDGQIGSRYALLEVTQGEESLRGRIGAGGATLEVRTTNGSIDLR